MILLSDISLVVIRMLILNWIFSGITMLAASFITWRNDPRGFSPAILIPVILVIASVVAWFFSPIIATLVTPKKEYEVNLGSLSRGDLYSFAFVFLGLFFLLTSLGSAAVGLYQYFVLQNFGQPKDAYFLGRLATHLITVVVGGIILIFADKWARSLLAKEPGK